LVWSGNDDADINRLRNEDEEGGDAGVGVPLDLTDDPVPLLPDVPENSGAEEDDDTDDDKSDEEDNNKGLIWYNEGEDVDKDREDSDEDSDEEDFDFNDEGFIDI
jgi:hypothetical protein